jgi:hypothetical protein
MIRCGGEGRNTERRATYPFLGSRTCMLETPRAARAPETPVERTLSPDSPVGAAWTARAVT